MLNKMYSFDDQVEQGGNLLKEPYYFLPALLEAANVECFIFSMSADGVIQYVSESVEKMLGYSAQEMVGKEFSSFLTENARNESVRAACWKTIPNEAVRCSCELQTNSQQPVSVKMLNCGVFEDDALVGLVGLVQPDAAGQGSSLSDSKSVERARVQALADQLSKTEREVVELVVAGHMNKSMAKMLGVAVRTIEARRARAMAKLQVRSLPDLVKAWLLVSDH